MVDWLNYHHLHYFWVVAKEGGITPAAELLHLSQPTLSTQIQKLEQSLGIKLFDRTGRSLVLTDTGQMVFCYAEEIFGLGRELTDAIRGRLTSDSLRLVVGVPDELPKLLVYEILKPALLLEDTHRGRPRGWQAVCLAANRSDTRNQRTFLRDLCRASTPAPSSCCNFGVSETKSAHTRSMTISLSAFTWP